MRGRLGCIVAVAYPIVEIAIAVVLAQWVGWWWLLVYAVACVVLGLGLVRYALGATGRSLAVALGALRAGTDAQALSITADPMPDLDRARRVAAPAVTLLIVPAGLLIAIPGFLTTVIGLLLWLPPVRVRIAHRIERSARQWPPPEPG